MVYSHADRPIFGRPPESQFDTPLRWFRGDLTGYEKLTPREDSNNQNPTWRFHFTNIEVLETNPGEVYVHPIAAITVQESKARKTRWDAWNLSLFDACGAYPDPDELIGRKHEWRILPTTLTRPEKDEDGEQVKNAKGRDVWEDYQGESWQVVHVSGFTKGGQEAANARVLELLDGKTDGLFYQAALQDPLIRDSLTIRSLITERTLLKGLEASGLIVKNPDGTWTVNK